MTFARTFAASQSVKIIDSESEFFGWAGRLVDETEDKATVKLDNDGATLDFDKSQLLGL